MSDASASTQGRPYTDEHDPLRRTTITKADAIGIARFAGLPVHQVETIMRLTILALETHERRVAAETVAMQKEALGNLEPRRG